MVRHILSIFMKRNTMYKLLIILIILMVIVTINSWISIGETSKKCFLNVTNTVDIVYLQNILHSERKPQLGKTVFFHETSCTNGIVRLNARQACAVESAAKLNPTWDVFLLFAAPSGFLNNSVAIDPIIGALQSYPNIFMRNLDLWSYAADTPADQWIKSDKLFYSKYMNSHASDFLRYLSLYKWGGTYLDLDVIVKRSFDDIDANYAGAESSEDIAAGVMNFDHKGIGHDMAASCLKEFLTTFNGENWGNNGPGVITRVLQHTCRTVHPSLMTRDRCHGFKVFPINAFYAVGWRNWEYFFDEHFVKRAMRLTNDSIAIHVWNKLSGRRPIRVGSKVAYTLLAEQYCPVVYRSCGDFF